MPKIDRTKLMNYLETEFTDELELSHILRYCEVRDDQENYKTPKNTKPPKNQKERIRLSEQI
jgi:hypothetical protein